MVISLQFEVMTFSMTLEKIAVVGYAYPYTPFQSIDRVSFANAWGSGRNDTYTGSFAFWAVAKRSIRGAQHLEYVLFCWDGLLLP